MSRSLGSGSSSRRNAFHLTHLDQTLAAVQGEAEALQQGAASLLLLDQLEEREQTASFKSHRGEMEQLRLQYLREFKDDHFHYFVVRLKWGSQFTYF